MTARYRVRWWQALKTERDRIDGYMSDAAGPLEARARELLDDRYARLVRLDQSGRVRFVVRGGERTFSVEELDG